MKNDINFLGNDFINVVLEHTEEKKYVDDLKKKYEKAKLILQKNNEERIEVINEAKNNKIKEINEELKIAKNELQDLKNEINNIFSKYCEINGHNYTLINKQIVIDPETFDYCNDHEYYMEFTYKCKSCGEEIKERKYVQNLDDYVMQKYEKEIPYEIYDDVTLSKSEKSLRLIEKEVQELEDYVKYLFVLKNRLCELFGHDVKKIDNKGIYECNCCNKQISYSEYIKSLENAEYKGVISQCCKEKKETPVYILKDYEDISNEQFFLPTYEEYEKKLVLKKENKNNI